MMKPKSLPAGPAPLALESDELTVLTRVVDALARGETLGEALRPFSGTPGVSALRMVQGGAGEEAVAVGAAGPLALCLRLERALAGLGASPAQPTKPALINERVA